MRDLIVHPGQPILLFESESKRSTANRALVPRGGGNTGMIQYKYSSPQASFRRVSAERAYRLTQDRSSLKVHVDFIPFPPQTTVRKTQNLRNPG